MSSNVIALNTRDFILPTNVIYIRPNSNKDLRILATFRL